MRRLTNHSTGRKYWTTPIRLPRTVRGQLHLLDDLYTKITLDHCDKDHELYDSEWGFGRDRKNISKVQIAKWLQECMEKDQRSKKKGVRGSWRNLWLMNSPIYSWFMKRKAWFGICLDCGRGSESKPLRRKEMFSMMGARSQGKWMTAPGTCLKCATEEG